MAQSCAVCSELPWSATYVYSIHGTSWHRSSVCAVQSRDDADDADDAGELAMSTACSCGPIDAVARLSVGFRRAPVEASPAHAALSPSAVLLLICDTLDLCSPCFDLKY